MPLLDRHIVRLIVSALTSGGIAAGSVILGAVSAEGQLKAGTWILASVTGVMAICKDIQSWLSSPPSLANRGGP